MITKPVGSVDKEMVTSENSAHSLPKAVKSIDNDGVETNDSVASHRTWRFWAVFPALMVTALLSAVEVTGKLVPPYLDM